MSNTRKILRLLLLHGTLVSAATAQTPQQQYAYGSVPFTTATSQVAAYAKNGQSGALSALAGSPFADSLQGGAMAIDGLGHFLFVVNTSTSNISMFQIDQSTSPAQSITVTSSGAATLHITSVLPGGSNPADFQVTNACSGAYPVAAACSISVTFSPLGAGRPSPLRSSRLLALGLGPCTSLPWLLEEQMRVILP